mgnify:CR=1 FL=1
MNLCIGGNSYLLSGVNSNIEYIPSVMKLYENIHSDTAAPNKWTKITKPANMPIGLPNTFSMHLLYVLALVYSYPFYNIKLIK